MERQSILDRRASRARQLLGEDSEPGATLDLKALRERLKKELALKVSEDRVRWLADTRKVGAEALGFEDLSSEAFQVALDQLLTERQEEKRLRIMEERRNELKSQKDRKVESKQEVSLEPTEVNDDRSLQTRILGSLAYALPLLDGLQFGFPLAQSMPFLTPLFNLLSGPFQLLNAIPFGSLIFFLILTVLVNNRELPRLLRFNMQQAVLLDVALFVPSLLASLGSMLAGDALLGSNAEGLNIVVFSLLAIAIGYSVVLTLLGLDPDGLPVISDASRRGVDRT